MHTVTELKNIVGKKVSRHDREPRLYVCEYDGELWATNSYWMVQADKVAPLLTHYNQPAYQPGTYEVNGKVEKLVDVEPPNVKPLIPAIGETIIVSPRCMSDGRELYVRGTNPKVCPFLAVLDHDATAVYVNERYLSFVIGDCKKPVLRQQKPTGPVAVYDGALFVGKNHGLLGLVMPVRL